MEWTDVVVRSADERGDIRQRVVDDAASLPGHRGLPRDADQHQGVHPVPLHPQTAGDAPRPVLSAHPSLHARRRHEQCTPRVLDSHPLPDYHFINLILMAGIPPWYVGITKPTRSAQPCIPLESLNRVPALIGWGKGGDVTSAGWQVTLCDLVWHVSSRSGAVIVAQTAIRLLTLPSLPHPSLSQSLLFLRLPRSLFSLE